MTGSDGVDSHRLHDLQLPLRGAAVDGGAEGTQVVVIAHTVHLQMPAVEQKALIPVEFDGADAEGSGIRVENLRAGFDLTDRSVQIRPVHIPALGIGDDQLLIHRAFSIRRHRVVRTVGCHGFPCGIEEPRFQLNAGRCGIPVPDFGSDRNRRTGIGHLRRRDIGSPSGDMHGAGGVQPDIAVNARTGIPA